VTEAEWLTCGDPDEVIHHLVGDHNDEQDEGGPRIPEGVVSRRKMSLFECACFRHIWSLIPKSQQEGIILLEVKADHPHLTSTPDDFGFSAWRAADTVRKAGGDITRELADQTALLRDIFGNPFRPVAVDPAWLTSDVLALAKGIYEDRAFDRMPILADALQEAGCDSDDILNHCRGPGPHARGCWVVDLILGKS
jgi:hypothetical protein